MITLEAPTQGEDPEAAARKRAEREGILFFEASPMKIGKFPAFHAVWEDHMGGDKVVADAVWIAYAGSIWRIIGVASGPAYKAHKGAFNSTMRSFRPLTEAEKESVKAVRLRVVEVKEGESLQKLGKRTKNEWTVHETAVRNGIFADAVLPQGEKLKVAIAEAYMPAQEETGASAAE
jgi:hypothetical protein